MYGACAASDRRRRTVLVRSPEDGNRGASCDFGGWAQHRKHTKTPAVLRRGFSRRRSISVLEGEFLVGALSSRLPLSESEGTSNYPCAEQDVLRTEVNLKVLTSHRAGISSFVQSNQSVGSQAQIEVLFPGAESNFFPKLRIAGPDITGGFSTRVGITPCWQLTVRTILYNNSGEVDTMIRRHSDADSSSRYLMQPGSQTKIR